MMWARPFGLPTPPRWVTRLARWWNRTDRNHQPDGWTR